jgi:hypothetical protein
MAQHPVPHRPQHLDWFAAVLSYMIPGLGQIYQRRFGKGLLFFFSLYALFFYGMWMGEWKNVYLPDTNVKNNMFITSKPFGDFENRPHFVGQMWIGIAAWPAFVQYANYNPEDKNPKFWGFQRTPTEDKLNELQRNGDKRWDLGWVYTVIAGVLNILVIYDALAGPAFRDPKEVAAAAAQQQTTVAS